MSYKEKYDRIMEALRQRAREIMPAGTRMVLFGSRARGDERTDSDWDIHILIPGPERLTAQKIDDYAWPIEEIGIDFGETVSAIVYSYQGWEKRSFLPFYKNVERDKVIIFQN